MADEFSILKYIQDVGDYVDRDTLIALGADDTMLDALVENERLQVNTVADHTIAHGIRCSTFDASHNVQVTNNEWLKPTQSLSIRLLMKMDSWTPGAFRLFLSKYNGYQFGLNTSNQWYGVIRRPGADTIYSSSSPTGLSAANTYWVRMDWQFENGSGQSQVDFKYSNEQVFDSNNVGVWTAVQSVTATQHTIEHSNNNAFVGGFDTAGNHAIRGTWYVAELWGEGVRRMFFDLSYNNRVSTGENVLFDANGNVLSITGTTNYLMQNTNGIKAYKYLDYFGDTSPA